MDIGKTIAKLRKEKSLTQQDLGEILNLSPGTISNYENGVHFPDLDSLNKLADFFHVTTDYLLGRTDFRFPSRDLNNYLTSDMTIYDVANTILALDNANQTIVIEYIKYVAKQQQSE